MPQVNESIANNSTKKDPCLFIVLLLLKDLTLGDH